MIAVGLNGTHKTNVTSVESAITTALGSLTSWTDPAQCAARAALEEMRRDLALLIVERAQ